MKAKDVIEALGALAHEHRLGIFRLLVEQGPVGLPAGRIAERVGLVPSSLTFHLQNLQRGGLITQRREGRQLIYSADFSAITAVPRVRPNVAGRRGNQNRQNESRKRPEERYARVTITSTGEP